MGDPAIQFIREIPPATVGEALACAFEALPTALLWCDGEGRVVLGNEASRRLFRVGSDALAGRSATSLLSPVGHGALRSSPIWPLRESPTGGALRPALGMRPDGSTFCARVRPLSVRPRSGTPLLLLQLWELPPVSGWEVLALLEPEGIERLLREHFDVAFVVDDEGRPLATDSTLAAALRIGTGDPAEPPLAARWPAESARRLASQHRRAAGGSSTAAEEYRLLSGGLQHRYAIRMLPLAALGSGSRGVVGLGVEIGGSDAADRRLAAAQRLAAIEHAVGSCAHDLKNHLSVVLSNLRFLQKDRHLSTLSRAVVEQTEAVCQKGVQLLNHALGAAMPAPNRRISLRAVVAETVNLLRAVVPPAVRLELEPGGEPLPVLADPAQCQRIVMNLVLNARDAMSAPGKVTIALALREIDSAAALALGSGCVGRFAEFSIADEGAGMEPAILDRIFDPLFSTKGPGGTGLGLATVSQLVAAQGGWLNVESAPGKGSTFRVLLPLDESTGDAPAAAPTPRRRAVLLASDEREFLHVVTRVLTLTGCEVVAGVGHAGAYQAFERLGAECGAVMLDLALGAEGGGRGQGGSTAEGLMEAFLLLRPETRIVLCGDPIRPGERLSAMTLRARAYLAKPYDLTELATVVQRVLDAP